jgi:general secretion pathway protein D
MINIKNTINILPSVNRILQVMLLSWLFVFLTVQTANAEEEVTLNFSDADLVAVINSVSQITGKNFIIDPRVKGKITVVSAKPLNKDEVYNVFLSILQVHGFATVPTKNAIKIIPDATAKQNATPLTNSTKSPDDQLITRVLTVEHINSAQLVPILRPLVAQQGHLAAYSATNMLIISDRAANIRRMERIVSEMDKESDSDVEIIKLKHAFAAEVVRLLGSLTSGSPEQKGAGGSNVKFTADERTNSVLLSGEKMSRLKYRAIISDLDSPVKSSGNTHVVYLRYAEAKNLADILNSVGKEVIKAEGKNSGSTGAGSKAETVSIQADETSNALVITAPAAVFPSLRSVIQQLDIRRAQVHIEAIIAEVSLDTANELGVQWLIDGSNKGNPALSSQLPGTGASIAGIATGVATGNAAAIPDGLSLALGNVNDSNNLNFITLIRALNTDTETNLLSTPSIVTLDNQEASIIVGQNVPFVTGSSTSSTTAGTANPFQTIERQDVGTTLKVKPQINEGNTITLDIDQEVSTVSQAATSAVDIVTNKRAIKTTVQLEDGQLLVLGGLIDDTVIKVQQKVPLLGDIPYIGALFRSNSTRRIKQNLLVFIRATIIRDPIIARDLSQKKYNFMRNIQLMNIPKDEDERSKPVLQVYQ